MGLSSRPRSEGLFGSRNTTGPRFSFGSSMPRNQSQRSFFFQKFKCSNDRSNDSSGFTFGYESHKEK